MIALEGASNRLTSTWQFSREYRSCPSPFSLGRIQTSSQVGRPRASLKQNRAVKRPISSSFSSQSLHPLPYTRFFISFNIEWNMHACLYKQLVLCCCVLRLHIQNKWKKNSFKLCPVAFQNPKKCCWTVRYQLQTRRAQMLSLVVKLLSCSFLFKEAAWEIESNSFERVVMCPV